MVLFLIWTTYVLLNPGWSRSWQMQAVIRTSRSIFESKSFRLHRWTMQNIWWERNTHETTFILNVLKTSSHKKEWKSSLYFSLLKVFRHTCWKNCWGTPQKDWIFAKLPPQSCCVSTVSWSGWKFKSGIGFCGGRKISEARANSRVKDENSRRRVENKNTLLPKNIAQNLGQTRRGLNVLTPQPFYSPRLSRWSKCVNFFFIYYFLLTVSSMNFCSSNWVLF